MREQRELPGRCPRPRDDEVGREREDALDVDRVRVADDRQRTRPGRRVGARADAHEAGRGPRGRHELRRVRGKRHDPARGRRELDRRAGVVGDAHRERRRGGRGQQRQCDRDAPDHIAHRSPANTCAPPVA